MKKRVLAYSSIGGALVLGWFLFLYTPIHKQRQQLALEIQKAQQQLDDYNRIMSELPRFVRLSRQLEQKRSELNTNLFAKDDILRLFEQLDTQARQQRLEITEITPPVEELLLLNRMVPDSTTPQFLSLTLKLKGDYVDFGKFLKIVEQSNYFRVINRCKITGSRGGDVNLRFELSFNALLGNFGEKV